MLVRNKTKDIFNFFLRFAVQVPCTVRFVLHLTYFRAPRSGSIPSTSVSKCSSPYRTETKKVNISVRRGSNLTLVGQKRTFTFFRTFAFKAWCTPFRLSCTHRFFVPCVIRFLVCVAIAVTPPSLRLFAVADTWFANIGFWQFVASLFWLFKKTSSAHV